MHTLLVIALFVIIGSLALMVLSARYGGSEAPRLISDGVGIALLGMALLAEVVIPSGFVRQLTLAAFACGALLLFLWGILVARRGKRRTN